MRKKDLLKYTSESDFKWIKLRIKLAEAKPGSALLKLINKNIKDPKYKIL